MVFSGQLSGCRGGQGKSGRGVHGLLRWIRSNPKSLEENKSLSLPPSLPPCPPFEVLLSAVAGGAADESGGARVCVATGGRVPPLILDGLSQQAATARAVVWGERGWGGGEGGGVRGGGVRET